MMLHGPFNHVNDIIFDGINVDSVRKCEIRTNISPRPSRVDASFSSKILCNSNFGKASDDLCQTIALLARMLYSEEFIDAESIGG